jgi:hypothetical protein
MGVAKGDSTLESIGTFRRALGLGPLLSAKAALIGAPFRLYGKHDVLVEKF